MKYTISFAKKSDEEDVKNLLSEYDLAMCGMIEEYVVLRIGIDEDICAAGRLVRVDKNCFHIEVFGVKSELRKRGAGGFLLSNILINPWKYCRNASKAKSSFFKITTVSKGKAVDFYKKYGFKSCGFASLAPPYNTQCDECVDFEICNPLPLVFKGG